MLVGAQLPGIPSDDFDVEVQSLAVATPLVVGEENKIVVTVKNHGGTPIRATVLMHATNETDTFGPVSRTVQIPAGTAVTVDFTDHGMDVAGLTGPVTIHAEAYVTEEALVGDLLGLMGFDGNPFSAAWTGFWDEHVAALQEEMETILFGPLSATAAEVAWLALWTQAVMPLREVIEAVLLDPEFDRLDPDISNNARQATRSVISHGTVWEVDESFLPSELDAANGQQAIVWIKFTNVGDAINSLDLALTDPGIGWSMTLGKQSLTLGPNQSELVLVTMTGPTDAAAHERGEADLVASSAKAPLTGGAVIPLASPPVKAFGDIHTRLDNNAATVDARSQPLVSYTLSVTNQRNGDVTIVPGAIEPAGWLGTMSFNPESQAAVAPGEIADFVVTINVADDALAATLPFNVSVGWIAEDDSSDDGLVDAPTFHLTVTQWHKVAMSLQSPPQNLEPGAATALTFHVENQGNGKDDFQVQLSQAPAGWALVNATGAPAEAFMVQPFSSFDATGHFLQLPSSTEPGPRSVRFTVSSLAVPGTTDTMQQPFSVLARALPHVALGTTCPSPCYMGAQETRNIAVALTNMGNVEGTFNATATLTEMESNGWNATLDASEFTLTAGASKAASLTVTSPALLDQQDEGTVEITLRDIATHARNQTANAFVVAAAFAELGVDTQQITSQPSPLYLLVNGSLVIPVVNAGPGAAAPFDVRVTFEAPGFSGSPVVVPVPGLASGATTLVHAPVPTQAGFQNLAANIVVDPAAAVTEYPDGHTLHRANVAQTQLVLRVFDMRVQAPPDRTVDPGQAVSLEAELGFLVENAAPDAMQFVVSLASEPAWTEQVWPAQALAPGGSARFGTNFFVPEQSTSRDAVITLRVEHPDHAGLVAEDSFTIHVNDTAAPEITPGATPAAAVRGTWLRITAAIWDASGVAEAGLVLVPPVGATQHIAMELDDESGEHFALVELTKIGTYSWHLWAQDASSDGHEADTSPTPASIVVRPETEPALRLIAPTADQVIAPGKDLIVAVSNTTGLQSVLVTVDSESLSLPAIHPIVIATDSWPDGQASVDVEIVDTHGSVATATFVIHIDGTPPVIGNASFDRLQPGAESNLTITVADTTGVKSVFIRVEPGRAAAAHDIPMQAGSGAYHAKVPFPWDDGSLTIIATDIAGNTASHEVVRASSQYEVSTPGWDVAPLLGLLVLAVAAVGRKRHRGRGET